MDNEIAQGLMPTCTRRLALRALSSDHLRPQIGRWLAPELRQVCGCRPAVVEEDLPFKVDHPRNEVGLAGSVDQEPICGVSHHDEIIAPRPSG